MEVRKENVHSLHNMMKVKVTHIFKRLKLISSIKHLSFKEQKNSDNSTKFLLVVMLEIINMQHPVTLYNRHKNQTRTIFQTPE